MTAPVPRPFQRLRPLVVEQGFGRHARRPGEPSRWAGDKDLSWVAVRPELSCEVSYDQLAGDRFRHATRFERWPARTPRAAGSTSSSAQGPGFADVVAAAA